VSGFVPPARPSDDRQKWGLEIPAFLILAIAVDKNGHFYLFTARFDRIPGFVEFRAEPSVPVNMNVIAELGQPGEISRQYL